MHNEPDSGSENVIAFLLIWVTLIGVILFAFFQATADAKSEIRQEKQNVVIEEDGSGTQYFGDKEVRTFPEGTFLWDCVTMGNKVCE
jgi:hypothetical protein